MARAPTNAGQWIRVSPLDANLTQIEWRHKLTGERRMCRVGTLPDDQPNADDGLGTSIIDPALPESVVDDELIDETPEDRVLSILTDRSIATDAQSKVQVYRMDDDGARVFCGEYKPLDFESGGFEMIRREYGGGKYEIRLYGLHPVHGKYGLKAKPIINIAEARSKAPDELRGVDRLFAAMTSSLEKLQQQVLELKKEPPRDPMTEMERMFGMMAMMRKAMGGDAPQQKSTIGEVVDAIKELRSAKDLLGDGEPEKSDPLTDIATQFVAAMASQNQRPVPARAIPAVNTPPFTGNQASPSLNGNQSSEINPTPDPDMNPLALMKIYGYANELLSRAQKSEAPEVCAEWVYMEVPDDLLDLIKLDTAIDMLVQIKPEFLPYREWLSVVRGIVIELLKADDADELPAQGG